MVAHGTPCLGPVTHAGCGALCPTYNRGCYGCYGPKETPNTVSLSAVVRRPGRWRAGSGADLPHLQRMAPRHSARRAKRMKTGTIKVDYLARVEGEGALYIKIKATPSRMFELKIFEPPRFFEAFLRGRALQRSARHHGAHLRHLPGRLPDERRSRDGRCLRRQGRRAIARAAAADLLRRMDRKPRAARLPAARAGLPRLRGRHPDGEGSSRPSSNAVCS